MSLKWIDICGDKIVDSQTSNKVLTCQAWVSMCHHGNMLQSYKMHRELV